MKKIIYVLITIILLVCALAIPAHAADGITLTVEPDATEVSPGAKVTYTFTLNNPAGTPITGIGFHLSDGSNLTVPSSGATLLNTDILYGGTGAPTYTDGQYQGSVPVMKPISDKSIQLMKLECTVSEDAPVGNLSITVDQLKVVDAQEPAQAVAATVDQIDLSVKHLVDGDHKWVDDPSVTKAATCTEDGVKGYVCSDEQCRAKKTGEVENKLGHKQMDATFDWNGSTVDAPKVKATVTCQNPGCDYYSGKEIEIGEQLTVETDDSQAKCGQNSTVKYTATVTITDGAGTYTKKSEVNEVKSETPMNHKWGEPEVTWFVDGDKKVATATRTCSLCGETSAKQTDNNVTEEVKSKATCEKSGSADYTAKFTFNDQFTSDEQQKEVTVDNKGVVLPALGHQWNDIESVTWDNSDPTKSVIQGTVNATCEHGEDCDYGVEGKELVWEYSYTDNTATCTEKGKVTATASATVPGKAEPYEFTNEAQDTPALGHDYAADAVFTWPEKAGEDNKGTVTSDSVTATLHCNRENEDIKGTVTVTEGKEEVQPTYEAPGYKYWTATAEFVDGKADAPTVKKTDPDHPYEIAKLEPEYTNSVVDNTSGKVEPDATEDSLGEQVDALVEAALTQDKNNGLDDDLFKTLQSAQEKTEGEDLSIETKLVVNDAQKSTSTGGIDGVKNEDIQQVYDISIEVTVSGKTVGEQTGQITQTTEPITFSVDKPEGGPIWYVMRYHGGKWEPIDSRVDGDKIVFSSDKFSEFAIISSSDLAMAEVTPSAIPDQTYTGSPIQPKVELTVNGGQKLTEGKDYVVAYENNTDVTDAARIVITPAEGSAFTGRIELTFKIVKAPAAGGSGSGTSPTEAPVPATGDETPVALYAAMLTLSAAALTLVLARRKRQK